MKIFFLESSWIQTEVLGLLSRERKEFKDFALPPGQLAELLRMVREGTISGKIAKDVFPRMLESGESASTIVEREGLLQVSDSGALETAVAGVLAEQEVVVQSWLGGKEQSFTFLVGMVMKATQGRANPKLVRETLLKALEVRKSRQS